MQLVLHSHEHSKTQLRKNVAQKLRVKNVDCAVLQQILGHHKWRAVCRK